MKAPKTFRVPDIQARKHSGPKLTMLTAYDAWMARLLVSSGAVDILLAGDSLGMVELGHATTVPVTMSDMIRHSRAVRAGAPDAIVVADMPFLSHQVSDAQAVRNAGRLVQEGGASAVKIEGGAGIAPAVARIVAAGIPVMGHIGLQPQSVHAIGGFRRQGRTPEAQQRLIEDGQALEAAGAFAIVLECVPDQAARALTAALQIPVIGIGSGPECDGQVLVTHDMLALTGPLVPAFAKQYAQTGEVVVGAARWFAGEVRSGVFPPSSTSPKRPQVVESITALGDIIGHARRGGLSIGLVPTMGALHAGHAAMFDTARRDTKFVVATIFVNPLQFDRKQDLEHYPRTLESDLEVCAKHGVDLVFAPPESQIYPDEPLTYVDSPFLSEHLCGAHRAGHFRGVATVVLKLFNLVRPDRAYFGEKDAQQLAIIQRMVHDLNIPVQIVPVPTVREDDGLAVSSRNKLLTPEERSVAPALARALQAAVAQLNAGERSVDAVRNAANSVLAQYREIKIEYFELIDPETLQPLHSINGSVRLAIAAFLGRTRLIDNVLWTAASVSANKQRASVAK